MIVADAGLVVALVTRHEFTDDAETARRIEPDWIVPPLWRAEVRNVRAKRFRLEKALPKDQSTDKRLVKHLKSRRVRTVVFLKDFVKGRH